MNRRLNNKSIAAVSRPGKHVQWSKRNACNLSNLRIRNWFVTGRSLIYNREPRYEITENYGNVGDQCSPSKYPLGQVKTAPMKCFRFNSSLSLIFLPVDENELRQNTFNVEDIESIVSKRHFKEVSWFVNCDNGRKVAISRKKKLSLSPTCDEIGYDFVFFQRVEDTLEFRLKII